ncbi:MAG TPA: hypothetical protein VN375_01245 [Vicinamibacteria bacterium]|nr:hypothetical protein [Vicinamibacteria bacterium]
MSLGRYTLVVLALLGAGLGATWVPLLKGLEPRARGAAFLGGALAALNAITAYSLVLWSASRPTGAFMKAILGGMVGRMAFLLAAVILAVLGLGLPSVPLAVSLLAYFVLFLVLELAVLHKRATAAS